MSGDRKDPFNRGEEFLQLFSRGAEFTKELLVENERLRTNLAGLEQEQTDASKTPEEWDKYREELQSRLQDLEEECESVRMRLQQVEEENQQFAARYLEVEEENNNLANLYVASFQLHSTLDLDEVLQRPSPCTCWTAIRENSMWRFRKGQSLPNFRVARNPVASWRSRWEPQSLYVEIPRSRPISRIRSFASP